MLNQIINPEKEFLIVRPCALNSPHPEFEQEAAIIAQLQEFTGQRKPVPVLEGDILEMKDSSDIILMHKSFMTPSKKKFKSLRDENYAAYLNEILEKVAAHNQDIVICLEPKRNITPQGIERTIVALQTHDIKRAYFDSFFGKKLDDVVETNRRIGTQYPVSYHAIASFGPVYFAFSGMDNKPDIVTVISPLSFFRYNGPVIYGAVGSIEKMTTLAQRPNVLGVYLRTKEKQPLKMLLNSMIVRKKS